jgi:putative hemolysin
MVLTLAFLGFLILLNGLLAMSELAVVSARKDRLRTRASSGSRGAAVALALAENPSRLLSTIQIGITLVGVGAGALGGATIGEDLGAALGKLPHLARVGPPLGFGLVVAVITVFSLVVGELIPKRVALVSPEAIACAAAPALDVLARAFGPVERVLSAVTEASVRLVRLDPSAEPAVTEEEIRSLVERGATVGVLEEAEQDMFEAVLRLGDRTIGSLMTPRREVAWIDADAPPESILAIVSASPHPRYPVARKDLDDPVGLVEATDLLVQLLEGGPLDLRAAARPPLLLPESLPALAALEQLREARVAAALVVDEHGSVRGIVTRSDLSEAVFGEFPDPGEAPSAIRRDDGSWLFDGDVPIEDVEEALEVADLGDPDGESYATVAGLVLHRLGRIPRPGQSVTHRGLRFEVVDMDGHRVDKVLVSTSPA